MQHEGTPEIDFFSFFAMTPDLVFIADKEGNFKKFNQAAKTKLEYSEEELLTNPIASFIHPDDRELTAANRTELLNGKALVNFENRYIAKSGIIIWLQWTSMYLKEKELVFAIAKDISEKKKAEIANEEQFIKFKNLASHFKHKIEKDRKYFAVELHEELAQLASAIKLNVEYVDMNTPDINSEVKQRIKNVVSISRMMIDNIKKIAFTVSPYILDDVGLSETISWYCKEYSLLNNIPCSFESDFNEDDFTHEMKLDFFRICQESLANVMRHASATEVKVILKDDGNKVYLCITDNGIGFTPGKIIETPGLVSMRELISSIDGELIVQSKPGEGTTIYVSAAKHTAPEYVL